MSEFQKWTSQHRTIRASRDWNALLDHGLEKPASYIVRKNGIYYEAINGSTGKIDYGGRNNAGGINGTDAQAVVQAAVNALGSRSGIIKFGSGSFHFSSAVDCSYPINFVGEGTEATVIYADNGTNIFNFNVTSTLYGGGISKLTLNGSNDSGTLINVSGLWKLRVEDVVFRGLHDTSMKFSNSSYEPQIENCRVIQFVSYGVYFDTDNNGGIVQNCDFAGKAGSVDIYIASDADSISICNNWFERGSGEGGTYIDVQGNSVKILANHFAGNQGTADQIYIHNGASRIEIIGNSLHHATRSSINIASDAGDNHIIKSNVFYRPANYAIEVGAGRVVIVEGNYFENSLSDSAGMFYHAGGQGAPAIINGNYFYSANHTTVKSIDGGRIASNNRLNKISYIYVTQAVNNNIFCTASVDGIIAEIAVGNYVNGVDDGITVSHLASNNHVVNCNRGIVTSHDEVSIINNKVKGSTNLGIRVAGTDTDCVVAFNQADSYSFGATPAKVEGNIGFVTENAGTAIIPANTNSYQVSFEMARTPTVVKVTPQFDVSGRWWISNLSWASGTSILSGAFTFNRTYSGLYSGIIHWNAEYIP